MGRYHSKNETKSMEKVFLKKIVLNINAKIKKIGTKTRE